MAFPILGFCDSDAWERRGNLVVGRARDSSYKEKLRSGIPIEYFLDVKEQEEQDKRMYIEMKSDTKTRTIPRPRPEFFEPEATLYQQ